MPFRIKVSLLPSPAHRVISFSTADDLPSIDILIARLANLWNVADPASIDVTYTDSDGDLIAIVTEDDKADWIQQVRSAATATTAKLTLVPRPPLSVASLPSTVQHHAEEVNGEQDDGFEAIDAESNAGGNDGGDDGTTLLLKHPVPDPALAAAVEDQRSEASNATAEPTVEEHAGPVPASTTPLDPPLSGNAQVLSEVITDTVNTVVGGVLNAIAANLPPSPAPSHERSQQNPTADGDVEMHTRQGTPLPTSASGGNADASAPPALHTQQSAPHQPHPHHHHPYAQLFHHLRGLGGHRGRHHHHHHPHHPHHRQGHHYAPPPPPPHGGHPEGHPAPPPFFGFNGNGFNLGPMHFPFPSPHGTTGRSAHPQSPLGDLDWASLRTAVQGAAVGIAEQAELWRDAFNAMGAGPWNGRGRGPQGPGARRGGGHPHAHAHAHAHHHHAHPYAHGHGHGHGHGHSPRAGHTPHSHAHHHHHGRRRHEHQAGASREEEQSSQTQDELTALERAMEQVMRQSGQEQQQQGGGAPARQAPAAAGRGEVEPYDLGGGARAGAADDNGGDDDSLETMSVTSISSGTSDSSSSSSSSSAASKKHKKHKAAKRQRRCETKKTIRNSGRTRSLQYCGDDGGAPPEEEERRRCRRRQRREKRAHRHQGPPHQAGRSTLHTAEDDEEEEDQHPLPAWATQARAELIRRGLWDQMRAGGAGGRRGDAVAADRCGSNPASTAGAGQQVPSGQDIEVASAALHTGAEVQQTDVAAVPEVTTTTTTAYQPRTWLDVSGKHSVRGTYVPSRSARARQRVKLLIVVDDPASAAAGSSGSTEAAGTGTGTTKTKLVEIRLAQLCVGDRLWVQREDEINGGGGGGGGKGKGKGKGRARD